MNRHALPVFLFLVLAFAASTAQAQNVIYVDVDAAPGGDGSSWANAYTSLQDALAAADGNGQVWIAEGVYFPDVGAGITDNDRTASFTVTGTQDGLEIYGGFAGNETALDDRNPADHPVVLSGDIDNNDTKTGGVTLTFSNINGANSYHVLVFNGTTDGGITGATVLSGVTVTGGQAYNSSSDVRGGGLYCNGAGSGNLCSPAITGVIFAGNSAYNGGGAIYNNGTGGESSPVITNSAFTGNTAFFGGAIYNVGNAGGQSSPVIINATFTGNVAVNGGAISNNGFNNGQSNPAIINATFTGNSANNAGGAIFNEGNFGQSNPAITNSIFYGNGDEIFNAHGATPTISFSLVQGSGGSGSWNSAFGTDGGGNIDADPLFADPENGDYRLKGPGGAGGPSSAIDAGTPDTSGLGLPPVDLAGEPRVTAVLGTEAVIDMGAYESTGVPLPVELASFSTSVEGQVVVLSWKTLSEKGSARFVIQRATGAVETRDLASLQWHTVATVDAAGTSTEAQSYTYRAEDLDYGTYTFRLKQEDLDGTTEILDEVEAVVGLAEAYALSEVYPNPSQGRATLEVAVREAQRVRVEVYDVLGRRVAVLFDEEVAASDTRRVRLDGGRFSSGVYFVRVVGLPVRGTQTGEDFSEVRRLVVAR